jgi:hypothetical protein
MPMPAFAPAESELEFEDAFAFELVLADEDIVVEDVGAEGVLEGVDNEEDAVVVVAATKSELCQLI